MRNAACMQAAALRRGTRRPAPHFARPGLLVLVTGLHGARRLLMRHRVRRALDATTGAVLLGFGARLATEHV
jgi:hypothetical protein